MPVIKIIIAGGRDFKPEAKHAQWLDSMLAQIGPFEVVCGMAKGADLFGKEWADLHGLPVHCFPAEWDTHGKAAGPIRNKEMGNFADGLIAFPGGKGTAHMISYMHSLKKPVFLYIEGVEPHEEH